MGLADLWTQNKACWRRPQDQADKDLSEVKVTQIRAPGHHACKHVHQGDEDQATTGMRPLAGVRVAPAGRAASAHCQHSR